MYVQIIQILCVCLSWVKFTDAIPHHQDEEFGDAVGVIASPIHESTTLRTTICEEKYKNLEDKIDLLINVTRYQHNLTENKADYPSGTVALTVTADGSGLAVGSTDTTDWKDLKEQIDRLVKENQELQDEFEEKFKGMKEQIDRLLKENEEQRKRLEDLEILTRPKTYQSGQVSHTTPRYKVHEVTCPHERLPENCRQVKECQKHLYSIMLPSYSNQSFVAACDQETDNGGWIIIQRRQDGSVNFNRTWSDYVAGFGELEGEFFVGFEKLHALTTLGEPQELYIILQDFEGKRVWANYKTFRVDSQEANYKLNVGDYSGDAGDSLKPHHGRMFSTWDRNNAENGTECVHLFKGAWWCYTEIYSNLNGPYLSGQLKGNEYGVSWYNFRGDHYSLKFVQMMIRPKRA